jgi:hypothetical protein
MMLNRSATITMIRNDDDIIRDGGPDSLEAMAASNEMTVRIWDTILTDPK